MTDCTAEVCWMCVQHSSECCGPISSRHMTKKKKKKAAILLKRPQGQTMSALSKTEISKTAVDSETRSSKRPVSSTTILAVCQHRTAGLNGHLIIGVLEGGGNRNQGSHRPMSRSSKSHTYIDVWNFERRAPGLEVVEVEVEASARSIELV